MSLRWFPVVVVVAAVQHVLRSNPEILANGHQDPGEPLFLTPLLRAGKSEVT